jgi:uracil-DNA glycosylase
VNKTDQLKAECASKNLRYVGVRGNPHAPICVVGEAPGADEEQTGLPFVGASGKEQDRMLKEAGITSDSVWFTNPYKVRPPNNDLSALPSTGISFDLFEKQFFEELNYYKPSIILAAGATPMRLLCPQTGVWRGKRVEYPIGKWRGSLLTSPHLQHAHYIIPIQHPAFILRAWAERQISVMLYERAFREHNYLHQHGILEPLPTREMLLAPTYDDLTSELQDILDKKKQISVDVEVLWQRRNKRLGIAGGRALYTLGIADSPKRAISFCFWDYELDHLIKIFRLLNPILRNNRQIGQNYLTFDKHWLATVGLEPNETLVDDTLIRHHVLYIELEHSLAFQTMQYTREPYYKDEGRAWYAGDEKRDLLRYNAKDAAVTFEVFEKQETELNAK